MNDLQEIRMRCLEAAVQVCTSTGIALTAAQAFEDYVLEAGEGEAEKEGEEEDQEIILNRATKALIALGPGAHSTRDIQSEAGFTRSAVWKQLNRSKEKGWVDQITPGTWEYIGRLR